MKKTQNTCTAPVAITTAITAAANMLAENLSDENVELLSASLTQLADTLTTILAVRGVCCHDTPEENEEQSTDKSDHKKTSVN